MLKSLTEKIGSIINGITGKYKLSESNIKDILKKIRKSLLNADVSWDVVKVFINNIRQKIIGMEITRKVSPSNLFIKIVYDELISILGGDYKSILNKHSSLLKPNVILLVGLQGVGKTSTTVKLAYWLQNIKQQKVVVASCDIYRPAAVKQLFLLSSKNKIDCFICDNHNNNVDFIAESAVSYAKKILSDYLIIDTAGRLHIDDFKMEEIMSLVNKISPSEVLLVVDGMVGQDIINSVKIFCNNLPITGFILTKMDGDSKGGVILSISYITKKPIRFLCTGENIKFLEHFYPDRIASRILGMGDISTLLEDVNRNINNSDVKVLADKVSNKLKMDLNDFKLQLVQLLKVGGIESIMDKVPGINKSYNIKRSIDDKYFIKLIAIINSMTSKEKVFPNLINGSRKRRIAIGSGTNIQEVNNMLKQFNVMQKFWKKYSNKSNMDKFIKNKFSMLKGM